MRKTLSITTAFILLTLILTQWAQGFEVRLKWKENTVTNALPVTIYVTFATWQPASDNIPAEGHRAAGYYPIPPGGSHTFRAAGNEPIFFRFQRLKGLRGYAPVMYLSPAANTPTVSSWVPFEFEDIPLLEWIDDDFKEFYFPVSDYESFTYKSFNIVTPQEGAFGAATLEQIKFTNVPEGLLEIEDGFIKYQNGSDVTVTGEWSIRWGTVAQTTAAVLEEDFGVFSPGDVVSILGDPVRADNNNFGQGADLSLAQKIYNKYRETFLREDVQQVLPEVLTTFSDPETLQDPLIEQLGGFDAAVNLLLASPNLITTLIPEAGAAVVALLQTEAIQTMFKDPEVRTLLQDTEAVAELTALLAAGDLPPSPPDDANGTVPPPDDDEGTMVDDSLFSGVLSVAFSPNSRLLASGSADQTVRLWDVGTRQTQKTLRGHTDWVNSVAFSPDGQILAASGSADDTIRLWNVATGETVRTLEGHTISVFSVAFSPDGETLASGSQDNTIRLWSVVTGETVRTLRGHTDSVSSVVFSPDGRTLASGSDDDTIRLWNIATGETVRTLRGHTDWVSSVAFSPEGQTLASGSGDDTIRLWNVATGEIVKTLEGHTSWVNSVAFSPDGETLASGSGDDTIRLWNVATGETVRTLEGHTSWVHSVSFSPDGQTLASGSDDGTVLFWNPFPPWDVNEDGQTTIVDLILVITNHNRTLLLNPRADVNGDGTVDKQDIVLVAENLGDPTAAAAPENGTMPDGLTPTTLQEALNILRAHDDGSFAFQRSITYLERLLAAVIPEKTTLLPNYPNPFNPETWIPYHLSEPADVAVTIHAIDGTLVRTLSLGQQPAGVYQRRSRAAYWDGKNAAGEPVASGLYFYTLKAGDFAATRKMSIRK